MRQLSLVMNCMSMSLIWNSMSGGWSPTGTFVRPGRSTTVRLSTEEGGGGRGRRERKESSYCTVAHSLPLTMRRIHSQVDRHT